MPSSIYVNDNDISSNDINREVLNLNLAKKVHIKVNNLNWLIQIILHYVEQCDNSA